MCLGCRQGRAALALEDSVELPRHLDLSVRGKDWDRDGAEGRKEDSSRGEQGGGIVEVVSKSLLDMFAPTPDGEAVADAESSPEPSPPAVPAAARRVTHSAESSPVAVPALASSALRSLSPRSLLACISSPMFADPLSPLTLDPATPPVSLPPSAPSTPPSAPPSTNIAVAQNVIMDTDNNDVMRALVAVFRHADRTPKQKVKLISKSRALLDLFRLKPQAKKKEGGVGNGGGGVQAPSISSPVNGAGGGGGGGPVKFVEIKFKKKEELAQLLQIVKGMIGKERVRNKKRARAEQERAALAALLTATAAVVSPSSSAEPLPSPCTAAAAAKVEERTAESEGEVSDGELSDDGTSSAADDGEGFEQAVEREMLDKERKEREKDPDYLSKLLQVKTVLERGYVGAKLQVKPKKVDNGRVVQVLLVCKWGGEMTHAGLGQARQYAAAFWDDVCPPPPIPASFFIQSKEQQQAAHRDEADKKAQDGGQTTQPQSVPASPASGAFLSPPPSSASASGPTPSRSRGGEEDGGAASVMLDHNNTLDQADRDRYKKLLSEVQHLRDKRSAAPHHPDTLAAPKPSPAPSTPDSSSCVPTAVPSLSPSPPPSFTDALKSGLSRLFRVPSAIISSGHRSGSVSSSHPQLVNTSVSDTAAASAVVNPLLQRRELERYREKQAQFEKQRLDFISGMQVYSSDEARVVASAKSFFMSTMEHAHGIGDQYDATPHSTSSSSSATLPSSSSSGHLTAPAGSSVAQAQLVGQARKLKENTALLASFKASAEQSIHHDAAVLSYLDDTSMAAESMARAKEGVKFLLMAENAFTPAQVTRHMLAVEQIARATSEAERSRIEKEEEAQLKKAKEEAEVREKEERTRAERKKKEQKLQEREERMADELAMREEDPITSNPLPPPSSDHSSEAWQATPTGADGGERREKDYKKRPAALSSTALPSSFPSPCSSPQPMSTGPAAPPPLSPPPYSPPPSPSSFEPNAMTAWGVRCLRWVGKPRDTLHHLYHLLKQLQTQIHSKCEFADKAQRFKQQSQDGERAEHASTPSPASASTSVSVSASDDAASFAAASSPSASSLAPAPPSSSQRPRRLSISGGSAKAGGGGGGGGGDVFEYVFEAGDEEIVGHHHKIVKQTPRRFAADHLLCHGETLFLLKTRWDRLISAFYDPVSRSFDPTKIPDVYDCFPALDTRVLTDKGLLFVDEIEARLDKGEVVLYACFEQSDRPLTCNEDAMMGQLVYCRSARPTHTLTISC